MHSIIKEIRNRIRTEKTESEPHFLSLMYAGEQLIKMTTAIVISLVDNDKDQTRYTQEYKLVRANSLTEWVKALNEIISGPHSKLVPIDAKIYLRKLLEPRDKKSWEYKAVNYLHKNLRLINEENSPMSEKVALYVWFEYFIRLRNKTRGHGALPSEKLAEISADLRKSIDLIHKNFLLFKIEAAYLHQNLSSKYKVKPLSESAPNFEYLKTFDGKREFFQSGIYVFLNRPIKVNLIFANDEVSDFYFPNGSFAKRRFEVLSYLSGEKDSKDGKDYIQSPGERPKSETQGTKDLSAVGNCFTNIPKLKSIYIQRKSLEDDLLTHLENDRHPIVTLVGRGGIGKTSLALQVLHKLCESDRFQSIIWLSSRDIDLLEEGAKNVKPQVIDIEDFSDEFVRLIKPQERSELFFDKTRYIENLMSGTDEVISPILYVFDNFETVKNPAETYKWLDTHIRIPNKILITSRIRDFRADYPIHVDGMNKEEFNKLTKSILHQFGITKIVSKGYLDELHEESEGHPYVAKILLGEVAKTKKSQSIKGIISGKEDVLTALFERTYNTLSEPAKRVFLTLSSWRSTIPKIAIEAVLYPSSNNKINVEDAIDELYSYSFIDRTEVKNHIYLGLPLSAYLFGQKKLKMSPYKYDIEKDNQTLLMFGVAGKNQPSEGIEVQLERFFRKAARKISSRTSSIKDFRAIAEYISSKHNRSWLTFASLLIENNKLRDAIRCFDMFIEKEEDESRTLSIWKKKSGLHRRLGDSYMEVLCLVEISQMKIATNTAIGSAASRISQLIHEGKLDSNDPRHQTLIDKTIEVLETKTGEENLDEKSSLAWLLIHRKRIKNAKALVKSILQIDPNHIHANNLSGHLHMSHKR